MNTNKPILLSGKKVIRNIIIRFLYFIQFVLDPWLIIFSVLTFFLVTQSPDSISKNTSLVYSFLQQSLPAC